MHLQHLGWITWLLSPICQKWNHIGRHPNFSISCTVAKPYYGLVLVVWVSKPSFRTRVPDLFLLEGKTPNLMVDHSPRIHTFYISLMKNGTQSGKWDKTILVISFLSLLYVVSCLVLMIWWTKCFARMILRSSLVFLFFPLASQGFHSTTIPQFLN